MEKIKNKKTDGSIEKVLLPIILTIVIIAAYIGGFFTSSCISPKAVDDTKEVVWYIHKYGYIYDQSTGGFKDFDEQDYADALVKGLLDEYSNYYTKEEYQKILNEDAGRKNGIGLTFISNGTTIFSVIGNSPADVAGMRAGDLLVKGQIDGGEEKIFSDINDIIDFFALAKSNSKYYLTVNRGGVELNFNLTATDYKTAYVTYYDSENKVVFRTENGLLIRKEQEISSDDIMNGVLSADTAYIKLDVFEGNASYQMGRVLAYMKDKNKTKLILDLRDNGGGNIDILTEIASMLIYNQGKSNNLIAYSQGKNENESYYSGVNLFNQDITAISVIANRNTASASECLIGAMLHYGGQFSADRLVIEKGSDGVARTFGKGIMQTTYLLSNGGALKLTTARILWPDKTTCIHKTGIIASGENATEKGISAVIRAQNTLID